MKADFDREGFSSILAVLMPGVAKKEILAQTTHIMLMEHGLATYNDNVAVFVPLEMPFSCSVPAKDFYAIVNSCKGEDLVLEFDDEVLHLTCDDTEAEFSVAVAERKAEELLNDIRPWDIEEDGWTLLSEDFMTGLRLVRFGAEKAITKENMHVIRVDGAYVYTAGEHRVSRYTFEEGAVANSFMFPATVVDKMEMGTWTHIAVEEAWIHLKDDATGAIFSTRTVLGDFNDVDSILADLDEKGGASVEFPKALTEAIEGVMILFEETPLFERELTIAISDDVLTLTAKKGERSKVVKTMPMASDVNFSFIVNPNFLVEILAIQNIATVYENYGCLFTNDSSTFQHFMVVHAS